MAQARAREAAAPDVPCAGDLMRWLPATEADDLAQVFKALADPVRLRLLSMICSAEAGEICVCYLNEAFDLAPATISYHLKVLRTVGLIDGDRRGTWVYYRVIPEVMGGCAPCSPGPRCRPAPGSPGRRGARAAARPRSRLRGREPVCWPGITRLERRRRGRSR